MMSVAEKRIWNLERGDLDQSIASAAAVRQKQMNLTLENVTER
jgi:hypothetical protein